MRRRRDPDRTPTHRPLHTAWLRIQEAPLELTIAALAVAAVVIDLTTEWSLLPWWVIVLYIALGLGGTVTIIGRFRDALHVESAGLALLIGSFAFITFRSLGQVTSGIQLAGVLLNDGALMVGFGLRLLVVRKAVRARVGGARRLADLGGVDG